MYLGHIVVLHRTVTAEDRPFPSPETLHKRLALLPAQFRIGVHGRHQNRSVPVVLGLLCRHPVDVDVDVPCEGDLVGIID